jgi:hypothetical protein
MIKPQDLVVSTLFAAHPNQAWPYAKLAAKLHISVSESHAAVQRCLAAGFLYKSEQQLRLNPVVYSRFIENGLPCVWPAQIGALQQGLPAAFSAPALQCIFAPVAGPENNLIWPSNGGPLFASSIEPIHPAIPKISAEDPILYAWFAWMEVFRLRRPRLVHEGRKWIEAALDIEQAA